MRIQILGTGCPNCQRLAENAEAAARDLGLEFELEKITDLGEISEFGVMLTPGFAVDGQLKSSGIVLSSEQIKHFLAPDPR